jgi:hypothetical protein
MALQHVQTTISETSIRMRLADNPDEALVMESVELLVPTTAQLTVPTASGPFPLGAIANQSLALIQVGALRYARDAIDQEIDRLVNLTRR